MISVRAKWLFLIKDEDSALFLVRKQRLYVYFKYAEQNEFFVKITVFSAGFHIDIIDQKLFVMEKVPNNYKQIILRVILCITFAPHANTFARITHNTSKNRPLPFITNFGQLARYARACKIVRSRRRRRGLLRFVLNGSQINII